MGDPGARPRELLSEPGRPFLPHRHRHLGVHPGIDRSPGRRHGARRGGRLRAYRLIPAARRRDRDSRRVNRSGRALRCPARPGPRHRGRAHRRIPLGTLGLRTRRPDRRPRRLLLVRRTETAQAAAAAMQKRSTAANASLVSDEYGLLSVRIPVSFRCSCAVRGDRLGGGCTLADRRPRSLYSCGRRPCSARVRVHGGKQDKYPVADVALEAVRAIMGYMGGGTFNPCQSGLAAWSDLIRLVPRERINDGTRRK